MKLNISRLEMSLVSLLWLFCSLPSYCQTKQYDADYYFQQANIKYQVSPGHYSDSLAKVCIDLYTKAIKLNPRFSQAYRNRGSLYFTLKIYKRAVSDLTKAINYCAPNEKWLLYKLRGQYFYSANEYQRAIADFSIAIPIDGNPTYLYLYRAKAYWKLGLKAKACNDYKISFERNPAIAAEREFLNCK